MSVNLFEWGDFSEKQLTSVHEARFRSNIWHGAVRSGKTIGSIVAWLKFIHEMKDKKGHFLMTGVTIGTLKDNILDVIETMVGPENYRYVAGSREVWICGIKCLIRGASDEASEKKIRGLTLKGHYGDECTLWPRNYYKRAMDRLSVEGAKFFGTTNPDSPYHWLKTDFIDLGKGPGGENKINLLDFHFELEDNLTLPPQYVLDLKSEFTGLWYKRFILGLWVVAEGAIYDMFREEEHVLTSWSSLPYWDSELMPPWEQIRAGVDYGTSNPTSFIFLGLWHGVWYAFAEHRYEGAKTGISRTDSDHSKYYRQYVADHGIHPRTLDVDPSAASFKAQLKRDGVHGTKNADNEVNDGIRVVARALTSGQLKIHISCKTLIKEFMTYIWDPKALEDRGEEKPVKLHDHSLDALRYVAVRAFGRSQLGVWQKPRGA